MKLNQPVAVHFGAGNIGRGLIGARLQEAGYLVVFADINEQLIDSLREAKSYSIQTLGSDGRSQTFDSFVALHSNRDRDELVEYVSEAQVITASVGAATLSRIAPIIEEGLLARRNQESAIVMACENAINASDILFSAIRNKEKIAERAVFLNTAVDRIIPIQPPGSVVDVLVEEFSEWIIDISRLKTELRLPGSIQVTNLDPYIERKLFTVNTAHLSAAYLGQRAGHETVVSSLSDSEIFDQTTRVLEETSAVLRARHGLDSAELSGYVMKTMERLTNPAIDDYVTRVGREPLRKLSRQERLIGPASYFAENIGEPAGLLSVVDAALSFHSPDDSQVLKLQQLLSEHDPIQLTKEVCGINSDHPLAPGLIRLFDLHKSAVPGKH